jgi:hypothetical protein
MKIAKIEPLQEKHCIVITFPKDGTFSARVVPKHPSFGPYGKLFYVEDVSPKDRHLIVPEKTFVWACWYQTTSGGTKSCVSGLFFSQEDLDEVRRLG